jgi:nicotinamidase-related amidase
MNRALLVIDVQNEFFSGKFPVTFPPQSLDKILSLMDGARAETVPIVVVQHTPVSKDAQTFIKGTKEWDLHDEVAKRPFDLLLQKPLPGSFTHTNLEAWLKERSIDTIAICGYMTQMCCDTTARQAAHLGFSVEFLSDATGTLQISNYAGTTTAEHLHNAILVTQAMRFSKVLTAGQWIDSIAAKRAIKR